MYNNGIWVFCSWKSKRWVHTFRLSNLAPPQSLNLIWTLTITQPLTHTLTVTHSKSALGFPVFIYRKTWRQREDDDKVQPQSLKKQLNVRRSSALSWSDLNSNTSTTKETKHLSLLRIQLKSSVDQFFCVLVLICPLCPACGQSWGQRWWPARPRWPRWSLSAAPAAPRCGGGEGSEPLRLGWRLRGDNQKCFYSHWDAVVVMVRQ